MSNKKCTRFNRDGIKLIVFDKKLPIITYNKYDVLCFCEFFMLFL